MCSVTNEKEGQVTFPILLPPDYRIMDFTSYLVPQPHDYGRTRDSETIMPFFGSNLAPFFWYSKKTSFVINFRDAFSF